MKLIKQRTNSAFTIVELLVVIVVIGILAAISIVAYTGVSQRAISASLQSDLSTASKRIKLFQIENSAYPESLTDCPTPDVKNLCIKLSSGNGYVGYAFNNSSNPQTFSVIAGNGNVNYKISNNTQLAQLDPTAMQPGVTPGAVLELHAAKANNGTGPGINSPLTTLWKDTSGNGNNGTLYGFSGVSPWIGSGTVGAPYALDQIDPVVSKHVFVSASPTLDLIGPASFTAELVVKLPPVGINPYWFFGRGPAYGALGWGYVAWNDADASPYTQFFYGDGAHGITSTNLGYLPRGNRLHLTVVINRATLTVRAYVAGAFVDQQTIAGWGSFLDVADNLDLIGSNYGNYGSPKTIYLARLYPFALSDAQVTANYNAGLVW